MNEPVVEFEGVSKRFGRCLALEGFDLRLEPGVSYGLLGRNGAGKSTALRLLMGLLRPTSGRVRLFGGDPIAEAERVKLHVGYLAEDSDFPTYLSGLDLARFFKDCYPTWDDTLARTLVGRFHIPLERHLGELSKGQKRQVGLLCAVAHRPKLLVLDEPGGGLDPVVRRGFLEEVIDLLGEGDTTVIFSSHHLQEVERIATRIGILHGGRIAFEAELDALRDSARQVLVELNGAALSDELLRQSLPGFLCGSRREATTWRLVFSEFSEAARRALAERFGGRVVQEERLALEEVFIAIAGDAA